MAHSLSAKKRIRQNLKRRARNRANKKKLRLSVKAARQALAGHDLDKAASTVRNAFKTLDKIAAKGTIHKNAANRRKSRLQRRLNALMRQGG